MEELNLVVHLLVAKVSQTSDSKDKRCTKEEAIVIATELIQLLALNHPLRDEYAQDLLDTARYAVR